MFEVPNVEDGKFEFDVSKMSRALFELSAARLARLLFVGRSQTRVQQAILGRLTVGHVVQVSLGHD